MGLERCACFAIPYCGGNAEAQLSYYLIFGVENVANINRIISPRLKLFELLFFNNVVASTPNRHKCQV